ncbi:MAG: PIN domain-containing protein [Mycobacteriales bacterium]
MTQLRTADTSIVVAALSGWHEAHKSAAEACRSIGALPGHVLLETISVMTRLPGGLAIASDAVKKALVTNFTDKPLTPDSDDYARLIDIIASKALAGGQVYDALVGYTAAMAGAQLLTRDKRAAATYRAVGVSYQFVDE